MEKNWTRSVMYYLVLTIFSMAGFILTVISGTLFCTNDIRWLFIVISVMPTICFGMILYRAYYGRYRRTVHVILVTILALVLFIAGTVNWFFMSVSDALIGTKKLNQYEHILEQYNYPDSVIDFFPPKIPEEAEEVKLSEHDAFLQGGGSFYLMTRYKKKDFFSALEKIEKKKNKLNVTITESGDKIQDGYYIATNFLEEFHITRKNPFWEYYIFQNKKEEKYEYDNPWNHGQIAGIAVNKKTQIIVYYYENW